MKYSLTCSTSKTLRHFTKFTRSCSTCKTHTKSTRCYTLDAHARTRICFDHSTFRPRMCGMCASKLPVATAVQVHRSDCPTSVSVRIILIPHSPERLVFFDDLGPCLGFQIRPLSERVSFRADRHYYCRDLGPLSIIEATELLNIV